MAVHVWMWTAPWPADACDSSYLAVASPSRAEAWKLLRVHGIKPGYREPAQVHGEDSAFPLAHPGLVCVRPEGGTWSVLEAD